MRHVRYYFQRISLGGSLEGSKAVSRDSRIVIKTARQMLMSVNVGTTHAVDTQLVRAMATPVIHSRDSTWQRWSLCRFFRDVGNGRPHFCWEWRRSRGESRPSRFMEVRHRLSPARAAREYCPQIVQPSEVHSSAYCTPIVPRYTLFCSR